MEALILSCGTGGGHNSACEAIEQALKSRGHSAMTLNPYLLKGKKAADMVDGAYIAIAQKIPNAFGVVYGLGNAYRNLPISSPVYQLNKLMVPLMEKFLSENRFDAIVCTHLFPAEIITNMKRLEKPVPETYFVSTDYTCIPFTEETDCDAYVIPARELAEEFVMRGIPKEKIFPLGIPVKREFRENISKAEARERLNLNPEKTCILIAGGSIGAGQIEQIVPLLRSHFADSARLIVICGNNQSLLGHLEENYRDQCLALGFTERMAEYMRACDLFLSKPGGLSSTEAAVSGTALIHITPIPGCETYNMDFFSRHGMSIAVNSPKKELLAACDVLLGEESRIEMTENQRRVIPQNGADSICELMESRAGH